jgi:hypothetical protein
VSNRAIGTATNLERTLEGCRERIIPGNLFGLRNMTLLEKVADPFRIRAAICSVKPKAQASFKYKDSFSKIDLDLAEFSRKTSTSLLDGSFKFDEPHYVDFQGKRPLLVLGPKDRAVERALLDVLKPQLRDAVAFAGTFAREARDSESKRSLPNLARTIVDLRGKYEYAFETDIKKFFPTIRHEKLFETLSPLLQEDSINYLIDQILKRRPPAAIAVKPDYLWYFEDLERGVPQGSCLSPILASIYLIPLDRAIESANLSYVRYVDDLVVFCESSQEAEDAERLIHSELAKLNLEAHQSRLEEDSKGHIVDTTQPLTFVGFEFLAPDIVRPRKKAIEYFECRVAEIANEAANLKELLVKMSNFTEGWKAAYAECQMPVSLKRRLDERQLKVVRLWLSKHGTLSRNYSGVPKRSQAASLGLTLIESSTKKAEIFTPDETWYECETSLAAP